MATFDTLNGAKIRSNWWKEATDKKHKTIAPLISAIQKDQSYRRTASLLYMSMYGGMEYSGLSGSSYARRTSGIKGQANRIRLNIVKACASTATSKIAKNKPRILHLTEGGDWAARFRAQKLTKLTNGSFERMGLYEAMQRAFLDCCVDDIGAVKFYTEAGDVKCERIFPGELTVDDTEAIHGSPRSLHQTKAISRDVLLDAYPGKYNKIKHAGIASTQQVNGLWSSDMVDVHESWHLPSGPDANDGRHVICIDNCDLLDEPWDHPYFPFVFLRWDELPLGFYGQGMASQLLGLQYEINRLLRTIQEHLHLAAGYVAIEAGSAVNKSAIGTNEVWRFVEFDGTPPQFIAPSPMAPEYFAQLDRLYNRAFEVVGVSQLSATAAKPAGLNSGKALREYNDLESERFQMVAQRYERSFVKASEIVLDLFEQIAKEDGGVTIPVGDRSEIELIDFSQAKLDRDKYVTRIVPTSFLPSTPAGKLATIQEMLQAGMLSREEGLLLLDYPDLEKVQSLNNAALRNIDRRISLMLDPDDPQPQHPEAFTNLQLAMKRATAAYEEAELNNAPEENLELLRNWISECGRLLEMQQPPGPAPMQAPAPGPEAQQGPAPLPM